MKTDNKLEILAIIPARGGSKGIPHKNIIDLCGKPLIQYTIDAAKNSQLITRVLVSTDDDEIANVSRDFGAEVMMRPDYLSDDSAPMKDVIDYILNVLRNTGYNPDIFILLQPTSPLRTSKHIDEALHNMINNEKSDATVSVIELPHQYSPLKIMEIDNEGFLYFYKEAGEKYTTRQELPRYYARNGAAIYAVYVNAYEETHSLYGNYCIAYEMKIEESIDIDSKYDLKIASYLLSEIQVNY